MAAIAFEVRLTPRAGRDAVDGVVDFMLRVRVTAPPVDGAANEALVRLVARELGVAPSSVSITAGARSRVKRLLVAGLSAAQLDERWPGLRVSVTSCG